MKQKIAGWARKVSTFILAAIASPLALANIPTAGKIIDGSDEQQSVMAFLYYAKDKVLALILACLVAFTVLVVITDAVKVYKKIQKRDADYTDLAGHVVVGVVVVAIVLFSMQFISS